MEKVLINDLKVQAYRIPTKTPEADGTITWNSTTMVLVEIFSAGLCGIGYTYADAATANYIHSNLKNCLVGKDGTDIPFLNSQLTQSIRNNGSCGIAMMAVSAVDNALWDLKAKFYKIPLFELLGRVKTEMQVYGSGGFTTYSNQQLQEQFEQWKDLGINQFKMKIGSHPEKDGDRVKFAREVIGKDGELFVDANGAFTVKQALEMGEKFVENGISWFEEPVSSDNIDGLKFIRTKAPVSMNIVAGEYAYNLSDIRHLLTNNCVDILQADATRCGGITNFIKAGVLAESFKIPFSSHCAPSLHLHAALSLSSFYTAEYFFDHARIEEMFFDGFIKPLNGKMRPDNSAPGLGLNFKHADANKYKIN